jgi:hypothetical protein
MDKPRIDEHGAKYWQDAEGNRHRDDDPAVVRANGYQAWYQHGLRHRANGPAIEYACGYKEWYLNNRYLLFDDWLDEVNISDEDKVMMKLKYG